MKIRRQRGKACKDIRRKNKKRQEKRREEGICRRVEEGMKSLIDRLSRRSQSYQAKIQTGMRLRYFSQQISANVRLNKCTCQTLFPLHATTPTSLSAVPPNKQLISMIIGSEDYHNYTAKKDDIYVGRHTIECLVAK